MSETQPEVDEATEVDLRQALFVGLNLDQGDDSCIDYVSDLVRIVAPFIAVAVAEAERARGVVERVRESCDKLRAVADQDSVQDAHTALQRFVVDRVLAAIEDAP